MGWDFARSANSNTHARAAITILHHCQRGHHREYFISFLLLLSVSSMHIFVFIFLFCFSSSFWLWILLINILFRQIARCHSKNINIPVKAMRCEKQKTTISWINFPKLHYAFRGVWHLNSQARWAKRIFSRRYVLTLADLELNDSGEFMLN